MTRLRQEDLTLPPSDPPADGSPDGEADPLPPGAGRKFHGRRKGKALRPSQLRLIETLLPQIVILGAARQGDPARAPVDPAALFGGARPVWLEIGFGGGEHLAHQAAAHPEVGFLGAEPFVNGVAMLLARIEALGLDNVRVHPGDARDLIDLLPDAALGRVFLLYPDPWPKTRHRERRFMHPETLRGMARAMAPGAELRLATDVGAYARHAVVAAAAAGGLALEGSEADRARPWDDWRPTRYEAKALRAGRPPHYLTFRRR